MQFKVIHILHLLIFAPLLKSSKPEPIIGRTRLMKMVFLFEKEILEKFADDQKLNSDFIAYNYGPYSKKVYEAIDFLSINGIIEINENNPNRIDDDELNMETTIINDEESSNDMETSNDYYNTESFEITKAGEKMMYDSSIWFAWVNLTDNQHNILQEFKTRSVTARLYDILKYVYYKYPAFAENSKIKDFFN